MFTHLRYLAALSFLIVIAGAVFVGEYAGKLRMNALMESSDKQVKATISSYAGSVWGRYAAEVAGTPNSIYLPSWAQETQRFFRDQPIDKITIYVKSPGTSGSYLPMFDTPKDHVITTDGTTRIVWPEKERILKGDSVVQVVKDVYVTGSPNAGTAKTMVHTIIPLMREGDKSPAALVDTYVDITNDWQSTDKQLRQFLVMVIGAFLLISITLLITASNAANIITKQHEVNLELIATAAQAEAQSREKSQFLASVSHELRTPLNAIIGFSEIIRNEVKEKLDKIYQDYLEDIHASGKHLLSLINDILDYSKAEAGKLQIEWAETDTTKIIRNSLRMVLPRAEAAQVTLVEDIPPQHLVVVTDAKKLKQVLLNLLSNAVKFTPAGGEVRCHAWIDLLTGALNIEVRDTGIGIAPKDISRVMTPFGQVDSALSRKYEGTGLGLPLSKKFVESMGGTFTIESELKVGTSVTVTIPKAPPGWGTPAMAQHSTTKDSSDVTPTSSKT